MTLRWLSAPSLASLMFALRSTIAALLALGIAFWMELGEPQWAAMTVWIVAQNSRGESISKGRWRVVGTLIGAVTAVALIAAFPQQPWLFLPALAMWVGLCASFATLTHNFRGYALVLAGYTCTIIALGAATQPDHVFEIAMARGTYILLGVVCEALMGMVFVPDIATKARQELRERLSVVLSQSALALADVLRGLPETETELCRLLGSLQASTDQIEFSRIEIRSTGNEVEHAYMTLGLVARVLSRGLGLKSRLASIPLVPQGLHPTLSRVADGLSGIPEWLRKDVSGGEALMFADGLLTDCRDAMAAILPRDDDESLAEGVVLTGVEVLLADFCETLRSYRASVEGARAPRRHRLFRTADWRAAMRNGARTMAALLFGGLVWEVTAWPQAATFLTFIAVVCARFATFENSVIVSSSFFYGAVWAAVLSIIPVFIVMPLTSSYALLAICLGVLMLLGGLAFRNPATAVMAASYQVFLPFLLGLDNQGRVSDLAWFNSVLALLLGLWTGVIIFRIVLPFTPARAARLLRDQLRTSLRRLALPGVRMDEDLWINDGAQCMERAVRFAGRLSSDGATTMLRGTLSVMTVGRNVLMLRKLASGENLPRVAVTALEGLTGSLLRARLPLTHTAAALQTTLDALCKVERETQDVTIRHDLVLAIGSVLIVRAELPISRAFLRGEAVG